MEARLVSPACLFKTTAGKPLVKKFSENSDSIAKKVDKAKHSYILYFIISNVNGILLSLFSINEVLISSQV
jgi:hypothetical protein